MNMITSKKLTRIAGKWQMIAAVGRKRITSARTNRKRAVTNQSNESKVVDKGCFVIYTTDKRRFVIPLAFLSNSIFVELLRISEEEFGLPSDGLITLPCDSIAMNYVVSLVKRGLAKDLERAVLHCIISHRCSSDTYFDQGPADHQQSIFCGF